MKKLIWFISCILFLNIVLAANNLTINLTAYYKFDSNYNDSLFLHNGTATNGNINASKYKLGNGSLWLTGNGYVDIGYDSWKANEILSIGGWMWINSNGAPADIFGNLGTTGDYGYVLVYNVDGTMLWYVLASGGGVQIYTPSASQPKQWIFVVATRNSTHIALYLNGVQNITGSFAAKTYSPSTYPPLFGRRSYTAANFLNGNLDGWGLFNRTLTPSEVAAWYNSGAGFDYPFTDPSSVITASVSAIPALSYFNSTTYCNLTVLGTAPITANVTWYNNISSSVMARNQSFDLNITGLSNNTVLRSNFTGYKKPGSGLICQGIADDGTGVSRANTSVINVLNTLSLSFVSKIPADITSSILLNNLLLITYNYSDVFLGSNASYRLSYKTNDSTIDCSDIVNGTYENCGYQNITPSNSSGTLFSYKIYDNNLFPETANIDADDMDDLAHSIFSLPNNNRMIKERYWNISPLLNYTFYEVMVNRTAGASGDATVFYCNSSYSSGQVTVNNNCQNIGNVPSTFNHNHLNQSKHVVMSMPIISGKIGSVKVTSTSYMVIMGGTGGSDVYYSVNPVSGQVETSTSSGVVWTPQTFTTDGHIHQFANTTAFYFYACGNGTDNVSSCSSVLTDSLEFGSIPPLPAIMTQPDMDQFVCNPVNFSWSPGASSSANIQYYNMSLLLDDVNTTFYGVISTFIGYPTTNAIVDISSLIGKQYQSYRTRMYTIDSAGAYSFSRSHNFTIDSKNPALSIVSPPVNATYNASNITTIINVSITDDSNLSCWYIFNGTNTSFNCSPFTLSSVLQGNNSVQVNAMDSCRNVNSTTVSFYADTIKPIITFVSPVPFSSFNTGQSASFNITYYDTSLYRTAMYMTDGSGVVVKSENQTASGNFLQSNFAYTFSTEGIYHVYAFANDSHTSSAIDVYNYDKSQGDKKINFMFDKILGKELLDTKNVSITDMSSFSLRDIQTYKKKDRYTFYYEYTMTLDEKSKPVKLDYRLRCSGLVYLPLSEWKSHFLCLDTGKWLDFESDKIKDYKVKKCGADCYDISIIADLKGNSSIEFYSIGDINTESAEMSLVVNNVTVNTSLQYLTCPTTIPGQMTNFLIFAIICAFIIFALATNFNFIGIITGIGMIFYGVVLYGCFALFSIFFMIIAFMIIVYFIVRSFGQLNS